MVFEGERLDSDGAEASSLQKRKPMERRHPASKSANLWSGGFPPPKAKISGAEASSLQKRKPSVFVYGQGALALAVCFFSAERQAKSLPVLLVLLVLLVNSQKKYAKKQDNIPLLTLLLKFAP